MDDRAWQMRIPPGKADQVVYHCLVFLAGHLFHDADQKRIIAILRRAEPMASNSSRMQPLRDAAREILAADGLRQTPGAWARAQMHLGRALARDAMTRAVEVLQ